MLKTLAISNFLKDVINRSFIKITNTAVNSMKIHKFSLPVPVVLVLSLGPDTEQSAEGQREARHQYLADSYAGDKS